MQALLLIGHIVEWAFALALLPLLIVWVFEYKFSKR